MVTLERRCTHLTNYSLNKHSHKFVPNVDADADATGSKWSLAAFKRHLAAQVGDTRAAQVRFARERHARLTRPAAAAAAAAAAEAAAAK